MGRSGPSGRGGGHRRLPTIARTTLKEHGGAGTGGGETERGKGLPEHGGAERRRCGTGERGGGSGTSPPAAGAGRGSAMPGMRRPDPPAPLRTAPPRPVGAAAGRGSADTDADADTDTGGREAAAADPRLAASASPRGECDVHPQPPLLPSSKSPPKHAQAFPPHPLVSPLVSQLVSLLVRPLVTQPVSPLVSPPVSPLVTPLVTQPVSPLVSPDSVARREASVQGCSGRLASLGLGACGQAATRVARGLAGVRGAPGGADGGAHWGPVSAACVWGAGSCRERGTGEFCPPAVHRHKSSRLITARRDAPLSARTNPAPQKTCQPHLLCPHPPPAFLASPLSSSSSSSLHPLIPLLLLLAGGCQLVPASSGLLGAGLGAFGCLFPSLSFSFRADAICSMAMGPQQWLAHPPGWGTRGDGGSHQGPNSFSPFNTQEPQLIFGGTPRTPNPKLAEHKHRFGPALLVWNPKPGLPAGPRDGRWPEGRRRRRGRCRGKLLISHETLSSHSCKRELGIVRPAQTQETGLGRGDMVVSSFISLPA